MKKRSTRIGLTTLALGVAATSLSACGGGGSTAPAPLPASRGGQATGHLRIVIPAATPARKPSYVSPSTQSISVSIDGGTATLTNLAASSSACSAAGPLQSLTCNVPIVATAGTHSIAIVTYDAAQTSSAPPATGHVLSENTVTSTFVAGQTNLVAVTLGGVPASVIIGTGPTEMTANGGNDTLVLAGPLPKTMIAEALDADGNVIVGPGAPAITITTASGTPIVTAAAVPVTGNSTFNTNTFTLTPTALGKTTLTLTATQTGTGGAVATATIPTTVSPILTVADAGNNTVSEYVPWIDSIPAVTISNGINAPIALAADNVGTLYVLNAGSTNTVQAYTDGGTTLARTITSGIAGPDAIAVDPSNTLYVANVSANTITEYASGSTTPTATITTGISQPTALAFDTAGTLYVANYGNNSVTEYATGTTVPSTTIPSTSGISGPFGLVVSNPVPAGTPYLFVANLGANDITSYTVGGTALQTTFTGTDFVDATPPFTTPRIPVAVDSTGKLYAVNYGANSVTTYLASAGAAPGTTITSNMDEPISAALDNSNNLYVANAIGGALSPNGIITAYAGGGQVNTRSLRNAAGVNGPTAVFPLGP